MHGQGEYTWPDGKSYSGGWREGKMHGEGKIKIKGKVVKGKWLNGTRIKEDE